MTDGQSSWERLAVREGGTVAGLTSGRTVDGSTLVFAATSAGVYRSTDHGLTWSAASTSDVIPFSEGIATSPTFAQDRTLFVGGRNGVYRSRDAGSRWTRLLAGGHVTSLAVAGDDGQTGVVLVGTEQDGILRSDDGGRSWASGNPGVLDLTVLALAVSPEFARDGTGFAATASGVNRSRNAGKSWREVDLGSEVAVQCLSVSPWFAEDRLVLAGSESAGLLRSTDGGARWVPGAGLDGRSVTALAFSNRIHGTVAAATDIGIAISRDAGESWQIVAAGIGAALTLAFVPDGGEEVLLAGLHRDGIARSTTGGRTWLPANHGLAARLLLALALSPAFEVDQTVFAAGGDDGVMVSRDRGQTWVAFPAGADAPSVVGLVPSPAFARDRMVFAATASGVRRSTDGGTTWQSVAIPGDPNTAARAVVAGAPTMSGRSPVLAALGDGRLVQSEDDGETWHLLGGDGFGGAQIVTLAYSPDYAHDATIFVGTHAVHPGEPGEVALWKSDDGGMAWQRWLVERSDDPLVVVVPNSYSVNGAVFVALGGRLLKPLRHAREVRFGEGRPIWVSAHVGAPGTLVTSLATPPDASNGRVLFAGTSAGVYVSRDAGDNFAAWTEERRHGH
jgi:photosystem II stability/assembly factor-like uncharacterized protein